MLEINLINKTKERIDNYEFEIRLPAGILKHWNTVYPTKVRCDVAGLRCFRFDQAGRGPVRPQDQLPNALR